MYDLPRYHTNGIDIAPRITENASFNGSVTQERWIQQDGDKLCDTPQPTVPSNCRAASLLEIFNTTT